MFLSININWRENWNTTNMNAWLQLQATAATICRSHKYPASTGSFPMETPGRCGVITICPGQGQKPYLYLYKFIFPDSTDRTNPIIRKIFKCCSGSNTAIRITNCRIIDPVTHLTSILFHIAQCILILFTGLKRTNIFNCLKKVKKVADRTCFFECS